MGKLGPGGKHTLSMQVRAMPLGGVLLSYKDSAMGREVKGNVDRRGLCGDVYLNAGVAGARIGAAVVSTSVRKWEIAFNVAAVVVIVRLRHRIPVRGDLLKGYLLASFAFRFGVELVRGNEPQALALSGPQLVLIPLLAWLVLHFVREWRGGAWRVPALRASDFNMASRSEAV